VSNGLALDWPQYSKGRYKRHSAADHAERGIWAGSHVAPWLYRACEGGEAAPPTVRMMRSFTPGRIVGGWLTTPDSR
jgi:hypothetical protein